MKETGERGLISDPRPKPYPSCGRMGDFWTANGPLELSEQTGVAEVLSRKRRPGREGGHP
jgi:hypothetical protein